MENTATSNRQHVQAWGDPAREGGRMNNLKSEINKAAHYLAQVQAVRIKYALDAKCRAMLKDGKSKDDVARYLVQIATDGGNGLDALIGKRYPFRTGAL